MAIERATWNGRHEICSKELSPLWNEKAFYLIQNTIVTHMAEIDQNLVWFLVGIMIVQGVWVAGLTYMMWKKHREKKKEDEETTKST